MNAPALSIIAPIYNEQDSLDAFFARLLPALDRLDLPAEIIAVDDGSADESWARLAAWERREPRLRLVRLSRNFGKDIALSAGLRHARGAAVIPIDADLQHPPELIAEFIAKWRMGYDMVYAVRRTRDTDSALRRLFSRIYYRVFRRLSDVSLPEGAGDFRLLDRRVVDILNDMPERARFMKGLFAWVGFQHVGIEFDPEERRAGGSSWSFTKLFRFAFDGLASFSTFPLTAVGYIGAAIAAPSLLLGLFFTARTMIWGVDVPGYASVIVAVLFLGGVQLLTLGVFGAYLGRVFEEVKRRPLFVVSELRGFEDGTVTEGAGYRRDSGRARAIPRLQPTTPHLPDRAPARARHAGP